MSKEDRKDLVEPVAWLHPTAGWANTAYEFVKAHCQKTGPLPIPLYAHPPASSAELDRLRRELEEHQAAKWKEKHVDTMNDMAALRIALEGVEAQLSDARRELEEARRQAFKEAAEIAESQAPKEINGQWSPYRAWVLRAAAAIRKCAEEEGK